MLKKTLAILMCMAMITCAFGASAENAAQPDDTAVQVELDDAPEAILGKLGINAIAEAALRGDQIRGDISTYIDASEAFDGELGLIQTLLASMLVSEAIQESEDAALFSLGLTVKDQELAKLDVSFFDDVIYASSDAWGDVPCKLSITEALTALTALMSEESQDEFSEGMALGIELSEKLFDPATWQAYLDTLQVWADARLEIESIELSVEEAEEMGHPEATVMETLEISGAALQSLADNLLNVLAADENMLGIISRVAEGSGSPISAEELQASIAQFQGMSAAILGGMLKPITYIALYDAQENVVYYETTAGLIISEEQNADVSFVYDLTVVDGVTYTSATYVVDSGDGTNIMAYAVEELEPIAEMIDGFYTQSSKTEAGLSIADGEESGSAYLVSTVQYETGKDKETKIQDVEFGTDGVLADMLLSAENGLYNGMTIHSVETTDITESGFVTVVDQTIAYTNADGTASDIPPIHQTVTMYNVPGEPLVEPTDAIDVLTMTEEQWYDLGVKIEQWLEALEQKLIDLFSELLLEDSIIDGVDGPTVIFGIPDATEAPAADVEPGAMEAPVEDAKPSATETLINDVKLETVPDGKK
jgi:hypothetical protein